MSAQEELCPFCAIAAAHPPYSPSNPPTPSSTVLSPDLTSPASFIILSTPSLIAFLDIMPLSFGHLLICPRSHRPKLSDVSASEARQLGAAVHLLSKALIRATGVEDWNVVQNNGAAAAQVVPHTHYHLIPRPDIRARGRVNESFTMFGRGKREELDDDEAEVLAQSLRTEVANLFKEEGLDLNDDLGRGSPLKL